jgi:hypothetical protein
MTACFDKRDLRFVFGRRLPRRVTPDARVSCALLLFRRRKSAACRQNIGCLRRIGRISEPVLASNLLSWQQQRRKQMIRSAVGTMAFAVIADTASFEAVVGSFQLETFDGMAKQ